MTKETTNRQVQELYPESDAATKRNLEGVANAISQFRVAVRHISEEERAAPVTVQLERARQRRHSAQRRVMLEWAFAAIACVALLLPGAGYFRHHSELVRAQQQEQALKQREADAKLLDQVTSEISETVPDAMRPLVDTDAEYGNDQNSVQKGENHDRN